MSPSNRAGDAVDEQVDRDQPGANGNGHHGADDHGDDSPGTSGRRRSVVSPTSPPATPERGSTSTRGASSSSITRRSVRGTFPEDDDLDGDPVTTQPDPLAVARSILEKAGATATLTTGGERGAARAMPPPPSVARQAEPETSSIEEPLNMPAQSVVAVPMPVTVPTGMPGTTGLAGRPLLRGPADLLLPDEPIVIPDPEAVGPTMAAHQVAPVPRVRGRRPRVRRVTRVLRHVDPWSVFKVAIVFNIVLYIVLITAGVLLWNVAYATGTVDNLERFFESFGWSDFEFHGGEIFHSAWIAGLFGVIGLTGAAVLAATLFNLITDLVGGVRMTVLEEEVQERTMAPMRRFVVRRPSAPNSGDPASGLRREVDRFPDPHVPADDSSR